ncbi:MAG: NAD(P)/FAD-dependent oxidoreductase [Planctomycetota bacterium]
MDRRHLLRLAATLAATSLAPRARAQGQSVGTPLKPSRRGQPRVLVIGAGISGLAAAQRLVSELGLSAPGQVVVLEARGRIGGRICTDTSLASPVELGANWIHGSVGNPISALGAKYGASTVNTNYDSADLYDFDGSPVPFGVQTFTYLQFLQAYQAALAYIGGLTDDESLEQAFQATGAGAGLAPDAKRVFDHWKQGSFDSGWSASGTELSGFHHDMGAAFGGVDKIFPGGYDQIPTGLAAGLDVRLGHVVERIDYSGPLVSVQTDQGEYCAEACLVTLPLGVLKAGAVDFAPILPTALTEAVQRMGFGAVYKLILEFPQVFWNQSVHFVEYISQTAGESMGWLNVAQYSGAPILNTWTYGDHARTLEALGEVEATSRVMDKLRQVFGAGIPNPTQVVSTDWMGNAFTGGSYSFPAVGSTPADYDQFLAPLQERLFFAGEHTSSLYPSTVHGAYLSGRDAAGRIVGLTELSASAPPGAGGRRFLSRLRTR